MIAPGDADARTGEAATRCTLNALVRKPWACVLATLLLALACSVFVFHPFTPSFPQPGLDPSWTVVMGEKAAAHARWGVDVTFTYGPASPLATGYYNGQYFTFTLPLLLAISLIVAFCAVSLFGQKAGVGRYGPLASVGAVLCYGLALFTVHQLTDAFFLSVVFLVFVLDLRRDPQDRVSQLAVTLGVLATGAFGLSKMSFGLTGLVLFVLADLTALVGRRVPFRTPLLVLAFLGFYLAYGQRISDLPTFLSMQGQVIAGYSESMSLPGSRTELKLFVAAAALLAGIVAFIEWTSPRARLERLALPLGTLMFLLLVFKSGFVRHDLHSLIAWVVLGFAGLLVALDRVMPRTIWGGGVMALASLLILVVVCPYVFARAEPDTPRLAAMTDVYRSWWHDGPGAELADMSEALFHPTSFAAALDRRKAEAWADIRKQHPLPKLEGSVDIIQSDQSAVMANGLDYRPRPSFQEYSTYTPKLIAANRAFYEGPHAPDWVLFAPGSIDERHPALAEGALWPVLLRRYEPVEEVGDYAALHKRPQPLGDLMGTPTTRVAAFDQYVPVDQADPVFARIIVKPNWLERLAGLLFRPPMLNMVTKFADGHEQSFRFFPTLGAAGFFLSPVISSAEDFAHMAFGETPSQPDNRIQAVKIVGRPSAYRSFAPEVTFEFAHAAVEHIPHSAEADPWFKAITARLAWLKLVQDLGLEQDLDGERLSAQPPDTLVVPTRGSRRVRFGFGIEDGAWNPGQTDGVCFAVKKDGGSETFWSRCLDPRKSATDRGDQSAEVELPPNLDKVALETSCRESCQWDWSYWKGFAAVE